MRILIVIFVLLVYFITQLGTVVWIFGKPLIHIICSTRQQTPFRAQINPEDVIVLKMDLIVYKKQSCEDHELCYDGLLYDIIGTRISFNEIYLTLQKDNFETE